MNRSTAVALAVFAFAQPAMAETFSSRQGAKVYSLGDSLFEVVPGHRKGAEAYWCAAGEFAQQALNAAWSAPVYIVQGRAPSVTTGRKSAVQFTLDPQANNVPPAPNSLSLNSLKPGENMSVERATGYCNVRPPRS